MENHLQAFIISKISMLNNKRDSYSKASGAKLRRAVGKDPAEAPDVWDITLPDAPIGKNYTDVIHVVLSLYALHIQGKDESMNDDKTNFGAAAAQLINPDKNNENAIRRRFNAVCTSSDFKELVYHAKGLIQMFKAENIKFNYAWFASDLNRFHNQNYINDIRLKWGKAFYNYKPIKEGTDEK